MGCVSIRVTVAVLSDRASSRKLALTLAVYAVERVRRLRFVQADVVSECPRAGLLSVAKFVAAVRYSVLTRMFVRLPTEEPGAPRSGQAVQYLGVMGNQVANSMSHELQLKTTRATGSVVVVQIDVRQIRGKCTSDSAARLVERRTGNLRVPVHRVRRVPRGTG